MKKMDLSEIKEQLISSYLELNSSYKVAKKFHVSATAVKRILKEEGVLRNLSSAAKNRPSSFKGKKHTNEAKRILSEKAMGRVSAFKGKHHTDETKKLFSKQAKLRLKEKNPNYKNGKYLRRPRDFKIAEFGKIRNFVFNRDNYTCKFSGQVGGHLHAHHLLPFWVCNEAFLDSDNLITVSTKVHFELCHNKNWGSFNVSIIPDELILKYNLDRERLNELAAVYTADAIVRSSAIHKTEEFSRND